MTKHKISIVHHSDEEVEYFIDGISIGRANHDDHGWAGMELAKQIVEDFAEAFGITILETYKEGEEE